MATIVPSGTGAVYGISGTNDLIQSKSIATKFDKKEALNKESEVIGWAFFGENAEHSIEVLGTGASVGSVGAVATAPDGVTSALGGTVVYCIDEISVDQMNDDFTKSSVKVSEYKLED